MSSLLSILSFSACERGCLWFSSFFVSFSHCFPEVMFVLLFLLVSFCATFAGAMCLVPNSDSAFQICVNNPNDGVFPVSTTYGYGNITVSSNVFTYISTSWSGNLWWRAVKICLCQSYNCQNGFSVCSDDIEVSSFWNVNGVVRAIGFGGSVSFSSLQFTGYGATKESIKSLPSCSGCFSSVNGVGYACCDDMSIENGVCTCDGNASCIQCSPVREDKEKIFPVVPTEQSTTAFASCNGCFSSVNGAYYACCDKMIFDNGVCTCGGNTPCSQCSPSLKDKEEIFAPEKSESSCIVVLTQDSNYFCKSIGRGPQDHGLCLPVSSACAPLQYIDAGGRFWPIIVWNITDNPLPGYFTYGSWTLGVSGLYFFYLSVNSDCSDKNVVFTYDPSQSFSCPEFFSSWTLAAGVFLGSTRSVSVTLYQQASVEELTSPLSCKGCFANVSGSSYACCHEMLIDGNACSCSDNKPCKLCSPVREDKEKIFPLAAATEKPTALPPCDGCFSSFNGVSYACCDNMAIDNGVCTCGGNTPCSQCSPSLKDKEKVPVESTFCWNPNCGLFSGTCCEAGKQCCYDSSHANPCTTDCACVCSSWTCPPNSFRAPSYFNWANSNGTCARARGATSNSNCLYDSASCQPWCLCNPGFRSNEGCFVEGLAPVLSNGYCMLSKENAEVKDSKAETQNIIIDTDDEKQSRYKDYASCLDSQHRTTPSKVSQQSWPFKMVSLTLSDRTSYCSGSLNWSGFCYASPDSYGSVQCSTPGGVKLGLAQTMVSWSSNLVAIAQVTLPFQSPNYWSMNGALVWTTNTTGGAYMWSICSGTLAGCQWSLAVTVLH